MVEYSVTLDLIFHALADHTRRSLLGRMTLASMRVTDLAREYDVSLNSISKHIKVLEKANLVTRKIEGRTHYCQLNAVELVKAQQWIKQYEKFWIDRLDSLEDFLLKKSPVRKEKK